ncbi:exodeoxyribonuclease VII large subunit [bacterium]|nr:exodeoxyribonuclease VII large subunit [bacterium]
MHPSLTVTQLVSLLREVIENHDFFYDLWLQGEVSNYSKSSLGHRYFSLKDERSVIRCVLFRDELPGLELKVGDHVIAHGRVSVYVQRGELQFIPDFVRPEGVGLLAAQFEQLKLRLEKEGLFDVARKRPLPAYPMRIGVVTSRTGAALQDIKNVLARRWPLARVVFAPAVVQGEQAAPHIVAALRTLARQEPPLDVAILARGGGSMEDLWPFNDERVARAIYGFPAPIVSGVGHETAGANTQRGSGALHAGHRRCKRCGRAHERGDGVGACRHVVVESDARWRPGRTHRPGRAADRGSPGPGRRLGTIGTHGRGSRRCNRERASRGGAITPGGGQPVRRPAARVRHRAERRHKAPAGGYERAQGEGRRPAGDFPRGWRILGRSQLMRRPRPRCQ